MANKYPLQPGDVAPDLSDYNFSTEADRRDPVVTKVRSNPMNYHGDFPAADQSRPEAGRLFKVGQATPNFAAPFETIYMDGDASGQPAEVHEINILEYGDSYDPTAPIRTRVADNWTLDSDNDGKLN